MGKYDSPEYAIARRELISDLDIPDRVLWPIKRLVECSLVRVFCNDWAKQDALDPEWMRVILEHGGEEWLRIDGWPEQGGDVLRRKWARRAALWMGWHSVRANHVVDWLHVAQSEGHAWLGNLGSGGHPKKLLKCGSIERLFHEARKGLPVRKASDVALGPEDEVFVADLGAGHTLVELLSPMALRKEGSRMGHCIGHGSYDWQLAETDRHLYSVRDPDGAPLATLEVHGSVVRQFRGAQNGHPPPAIIYLLADAAFTFGWLGLGEAAIGGSGYGPEAVAILGDLPPVRRRP
ncbi:PcfJ domain-containing protein [Agrobacterium pusense]|uniref:PcfJ domain-containing protein n=1 Tax=Agrobacterium pusense TaxID=648995 RepID=UPI001F2EBDF3|nr:PcfJ domain-containing protein [Agrobacterium pusense]